MRGKKTSTKGGIGRSPAPIEAPHRPEALTPLLELAADYYWEQDADHRFTLWRPMRANAVAPSTWLGKTSAELSAALPSDPELWARHRAALAAHAPFRDVAHTLRGDAALVHLSLSGVPAFDAAGRFLGYRGVARNIGALLRLEQLLELEGSVSRALAEADSVAAALPRVLARVCELALWDGGRYWQVDDRSRTVRAVASVGQGSASLLAAGAPAPAWLGSDPVWIADSAEDPRTAALATAWRSALLVPVVTGATLVGVLDFGSQRHSSQDVGLLRVLRGVAVQLAHLHARSAAAEQLRESEARFASTMELAAIGISHVDDDGRFLYVNPQLCAMLGYTERELLARTVKDISHRDDAAITTELSEQLRRGEIASFKAEKRYVHRDGSVIWVGLTIAAKRDREGRKLYDVSIVEDISARKEAEQRVRYLASHDTLTNLPNRATFGQLLVHASETARRNGQRLAVLFIDLDRFKIVNDTLGHEAGDDLLREAAARLRRAVRASDVVARLGGDEFVVLLQNIPDQATAGKVANNIVAVLRAPAQIHGNECSISASIGICMHPDGSQEDQAVLRNADMAMYLAKQSGKNGYRFYVDELRAFAAERAAIEADLRNAWERKECVLEYEAQLDAAGAVIGFAARVRWRPRELAALPADKVASVAEEAGLSGPINRWALRAACDASSVWQRAGLAPVRLAVSVAKSQLRDPAFVTDVHDALHAAGLKPRQLEVDITEEAVLGEPERAAFALVALAELGVTIAIDAFGTGRASFADLRRFRVNVLKLDAQRVAGVGSDTEKQRYVEGVVALAKALGFTVVAKGVATEADAAWLRKSGCAAWQGPFGPHALAAEECEALLRAR